MHRHVVSSLGMTRWSPNAALRLEQAALGLFEEAGFSATTVPEIAERAGLTTRTFFRHFADKREVLFLRDREFPAVVAQALSGLPEPLSVEEILRRGLLGAASELEIAREPIARRREIIRSEAHLRERELLKLDRLADAIHAALLNRGVEGTRARLLSRLAALVFDLSVDQWLDSSPADSLSAILMQTWSDLRHALRPRTPSELSSHAKSARSGQRRDPGAR